MHEFSRVYKVICQKAILSYNRGNYNFFKKPNINKKNFLAKIIIKNQSKTNLRRKIKNRSSLLTTYIQLHSHLVE